MRGHDTYGQEEQSSWPFSVGNITSQVISKSSDRCICKASKSYLKQESSMETLFVVAAIAVVVSAINLFSRGV